MKLNNKNKTSTEPTLQSYSVLLPNKLELLTMLKWDKVAAFGKPVVPWNGQWEKSLRKVWENHSVRVSELINWTQSRWWLEWLLKWTGCLWGHHVTASSAGPGAAVGGGCSPPASPPPNWTFPAAGCPGQPRSAVLEVWWGNRTESSGFMSPLTIYTWHQSWSTIIECSSSTNSTNKVILVVELI